MPGMRRMSKTFPRLSSSVFLLFNGCAALDSGIAALTADPPPANVFTIFGVITLLLGSVMGIWKRAVEQTSGRRVGGKIDWQSYHAEDRRFRAALHLSYFTLLCAGAIRTAANIRSGEPFGSLLLLTIVNAIIWFSLGRRMSGGTAQRRPPELGGEDS